MWPWLTHTTWTWKAVYIPPVWLYSLALLEMKAWSLASLDCRSISQTISARKRHTKQYQKYIQMYWKDETSPSKVTPECISGVLAINLHNSSEHDFMQCSHNPLRSQDSRVDWSDRVSSSCAETDVSIALLSSWARTSDSWDDVRVPFVLVIAFSLILESSIMAVVE